MCFCAGRGRWKKYAGGCRRNCRTVEKAVRMAEMMNIPILGLVENMSYITCPDCGKKLRLFGEGKTAGAAKRHSLPLLAEMPIDPALAALVDAGEIENFQGSWLDAAADLLEKT